MIFDSPSDPNKLSRHDIQTAYLADETDCVANLISQLNFTAEQTRTIQRQAYRLVENVRKNSDNMSGLNAFLQEYDLSSKEGVVLLCLAEALLRIPDPDTADMLIRDKLLTANWQQHLGSSASWFVNASTWGLMLTGRLFTLDEVTDAESTNLVNSMLSRISEPVIRAALKEAMRIMGHQFVMGRTIDEALKRSHTKENKQFRYSFDMLGEAAICQHDADRYFSVYLNAIQAIAKQRDRQQGIYSAPNISVKLSALHPRFEFAQRHRVINELIPRVKLLAEAAHQANISMTIDGEEADRLEPTLDVIEAILTDPSFSDWPGLGMVVQAYQKRALAVVNWIAEATLKHQRKIMVRLVKGAYWDSEIKRAQELGLDNYPVFTRKQHTDVSYIACAQQLLAMGDDVYLQFATHNAQTVSTLLHLIQDRKSFEFQRLHGMGELLYKELLVKRPDLACRVYAPVGVHKDLLPYLVRRLLENGANTSFVNRITDARLPIEEVIANPLQHVADSDMSPHPNIPRPEYLFGDTRLNSKSVNLADEIELARLQVKLRNLADRQWLAAPIINGQIVAGPSHQVFSPFNTGMKIGEVTAAAPEHIEQALQTAHHGHENWETTPIQHRAAILDRVAENIEKQAEMFVLLLVMEGGRCIPDAVAEIREAMDFCRYYAAIAREQIGEIQHLAGPTGESNQLSLHGRGIFVCISPWNFPLAIFCGQIAAALVTGNSVIAKPANQTPLIGMQLVQLMHRSGVPVSVLQFLPGPGSLIGDLMIQDHRVAGVAFTGSTTTANHINLKLAQRDGAIVPLIAETGGQNAMIVDSSALPEQVVSDVIRSAFNSAGQRCSALRVLFLQEEIAPRIIELLAGAMQELAVGDPRFIATDIGSVIDSAAQENLLQHIRRMHAEAKLIYQLDASRVPETGYYVAPCAFELRSLKQLEKEVFGPVLHVVRYKAEQLDDVITQINNTHYGLTLGVHSRILARARYIQQRARVGNMYVNRNIIGATVGVQPFGGEGLSGTGPKAGGPFYLYRFCTERVMTMNDSAIGGNASLLVLE